MATVFDLKAESEFIQACISGNTAQLEAMLKRNPALVNIPASNGSYPLMFAAYKGHQAAVSLLLQNKADIDATPASGPNQGKTALWWAVANKQEALAHKLLDAGAKNLDATPASGPEQGKTALWGAVAYKQEALAYKLLDAGAKNLDASPTSGPDQGKTVLVLAVAYKQEALGHKLLDAGAKNLDATPTSGPNQGKTALWMAVANKQETLAHKLLDAGAKNLDASPTSGPHQGMTALHCSALYGSFEIAQALLSKGAALDKGRPLNEPLNRGRQEYSTVTSQHDKVRDLLKYACELFEAAKSKGPETTATIKDLIKKLGSGINGTQKGKTALQLAMEHNNQPAVELLISAGSPIPPEGPAESEGYQLPIVKTFKMLSALETKIQALKHAEKSSKEPKDSKDAKEQKESKESKDTIEVRLLSTLEPDLKAEIAALPDKIAELALTLAEPFKSQVFYRLGIALYQILADIGDDTFVSQALREVSLRIEEVRPKIRGAYTEAQRILHELSLKRKQAAPDPGSRALSLEVDQTDDDDSAKALEYALNSANFGVDPRLVQNAFLHFVTGKSATLDKINIQRSPDAPASLGTMFVNELKAGKALRNELKKAQERLATYEKSEKPSEKETDLPMVSASVQAEPQIQTEAQAEVPVDAEPEVQAMAEAPPLPPLVFSSSLSEPSESGWLQISQTKNGEATASETLPSAPKPIEPSTKRIR